MGIGRLAPLLLVLLSTPACQAKEPAAVPQDSTRSAPSPVTAEMISEHASIQPGGTTRIGVHFEIEEGWHIYADPPGDAGLPTRIAWSGSTLVSFGPVVYPPAEQFIDPGDIRTRGYSGSAVLFSTVTLDPLWNRRGNVVEQSALVGLNLSAAVKWLACHEICVPGKADLTLMLPVSDQSPVFSTHAELFEQVQ